MSCSLERITITGPQNFSEVILQHVKVLAVDQLAGERQQHPTIAKAVTVELTSEQSSEGAVGDQYRKAVADPSPGEGGRLRARQRVTEKDLMPGENNAEPLRLAEAPPPVAAPAAPLAAPQQTTANVTVVRGTKREEYAVLRGER